MRAFFIILTIIIGLSESVGAQIGGLSNSKLNALCTNVVKDKRLEFEPSISYASSNKFWNNRSKLQTIYNSPDSINRTTSLNFRVTYGLWDKLEVGGAISTALSAANLGVKYLVLDDDWRIATIAGASIPLGNTTIDKSARTIENTTSVGLGFIVSTEFTDEFSFDFDAQIHSFLNKTEEKHKADYFVNADIGYYVLDEQLQLIAGVAYQKSSFECFDSYLLTIYPGVTVETGKNYTIILSFPIDVSGKNNEKSFGLNLATCFTFK